MIQKPLYRRSQVPKEQQKRLEKAFSFLKEQDFTQMLDGVYEIEGDKVYAMVQSFHVQEPIDAEFETHRKYIDIQYVISGKLDLLVTDYGKLKPKSVYDEKNDVVFYERSSCYSRIVLYPGESLLLYPEDAHRMVCFPENTECMDIRKCVIKVLI